MAEVDELAQAVKIADRVLDIPYLDPDGDDAVVARHLIRVVEASARILTHRNPEEMEKYRVRLTTILTIIRGDSDA